jgi:hypothetical protein
MNKQMTLAAAVVVGAIGTTTAYASPMAAQSSHANATSANPTRTSDARRVRVPNEVGKNHQAAQDDLQAHGFFNLRERDCTGRGRLLLFDRNWRVVRQSPRAGSRVSRNRAITLCSVKYSD